MIPAHEVLPEEIDAAQKVGRYIGRSWPNVQTEDLVSELIVWLYKPATGKHLARWRDEGTHGMNKLKVSLKREANKYARKEHGIVMGGTDNIPTYTLEQVEGLVTYVLQHDDWAAFGGHDAAGEVLASLADAAAAVHALTKADREVLELRFGRDLKLADVALELGCSEDAARMRVSRVLDRLRGRMNGETVMVSGQRRQSVSNAAAQAMSRGAEWA